MTMVLRAGPLRDVPYGTCTRWYTRSDDKARPVVRRRGRAHPWWDRRPVPARDRRGGRHEPPDADPPLRVARGSADRGRAHRRGRPAALPRELRPRRRSRPDPSDRRHVAAPARPGRLADRATVLRVLRASEPRG